MVIEDLACDRMCDVWLCDLVIENVESEVPKLRAETLKSEYSRSCATATGNLGGKDKVRVFPSTGWSAPTQMLPHTKRVAQNNGQPGPRRERWSEGDGKPSIVGTR